MSSYDPSLSQSKFRPRQSYPGQRVKGPMKLWSRIVGEVERFVFDSLLGASTGRWAVSFYAVQAVAKRPSKNAIFLLDEPGEKWEKADQMGRRLTQDFCKNLLENEDPLKGAGGQIDFFLIFMDSKGELRIWNG